jgi:hypothetical protein
MSAYKKLNKQDAYITTYTARKSWAVSGSDYSANRIETLVGISGSSNYYLPTNEIQSISYKRLIFQSTNHLYYSLFQSGSITTTGSYDNFLQSSYTSGSRNIHSYIGVYSMPRDIVGTHIEPFSLEIVPEAGVSSSYVLSSYARENAEDDYVEDFFNIYGSTPNACNIIGSDYLTNEGNYVQETPAAGGEYLDTPDGYSSTIVDDGEGNLYLKCSSPRKYVGNVIYTHGQIIITDELVANYLMDYVDGTVRWKSNHPIYTHNYHCRIRESEFNHTYNPSALSSSIKTTYYNDGTEYSNTLASSTGDLHNNVTGSYFQPYITTVGLYNDANELIAVGKMGQPVPKSANTDMTFIVKIDI